jgi:signal transduction histidine kinase
VELSAIAAPLLLLGGLICVRKPREPIGWLLLCSGLAMSGMIGLGEYAMYSVFGRSHPLPFTGAAAWVSSVLQAGGVFGILIIMVLFPTGRLLSSRWRPLGWAVVVAGITAFAVTALGGPDFNSNLDSIRNPIGIDHPARVLVALALVGDAITFLAIAGAGAQLLVRLIRSRGDEAEQLKWFVYTAVVGPLILFVTPSVVPHAVGSVFQNVAWTVVPISLVAAVAIAILKYRLYDVDVVINKTLVYGSLAAFVTVVYVGIVVGLGALIGLRSSSKPNLGLSILATALVAVAFQPVREWIQRFANRLVYGQRATPYEVLSEFSSRMAGAYESEDLLPRMARILGEGTGAGSARVWLKVGDELRAEATWPATDDAPALPMGDSALPAVPDASLVLPVRHRGDLLGALSLTKPPGERLTPTEEKLAADLASGAGLVLRNVRLSEELLARLEDLRASRQRLVAAQDAERRRLERNIHDGAQQQLVALAVKVRLARQLTARDPAKANELLQQTEAEVSQALGDLRDLARGIYPPLLADQGLVAALESQVRRSAVPVQIEADGIGRYPQDIEAAVYFCCLEAMQNVAKYARASSARIHLAERGGHLAFEISDDGAGFDPGALGYGTGLQGMADRLAALGGELRVDSEVGGGTTLHGRLPVGAPELVG